MTDQLALTLPEARARRDDGISRAIDHAEAVKAGWRKDALELFRRHALTHEVFLTEDVREANPGFHVPPECDERAWGQVARDAIKHGYVERAGFAPAKSSNCSAKVMWRSLILTPAVAA